MEKTKKCSIQFQVLMSFLSFLSHPNCSFLASLLLTYFLQLGNRASCSFHFIVSIFSFVSSMDDSVLSVWTGHAGAEFCELWAWEQKKYTYTWKYYSSKILYLENTKKRIKQFLKK